MLQLDFLLLKRHFWVKVMRCCLDKMGRYLRLMNEAIDEEDIEAFKIYDKNYVHYQNMFDKAFEKGEKIKAKMEAKISKERERG